MLKRNSPKSWGCTISAQSTTRFNGLIASLGDRGEYLAVCADVTISLAAGSQCNSFSKASLGCLCITHRLYPEVLLCLRWYHPPLFSFMVYFMRIGISMCTEERCLSHLFSVSSQISFRSLMQNTSELKGKPENGSLCNTLDYSSCISSF